MIRVVCLEYGMVDIRADTEGEIVFVVDVVLPHPDINYTGLISSDGVTYFRSNVDEYGEKVEIQAWEIQWCLEDEDDEDDPHGSYPLAHKIYSFIKDFGMDVEIFKENN